MVEFDQMSMVAILLVIGVLTYVYYVWKQDQATAKEAKENAKTLIFEQVQVDENARKQQSWKRLSQFPFKEKYDEVVKGTGDPKSEPAVNMLVQRACFAVKRIYEHQHFHGEVVASKNQGLVKDDEWQEFLEAKTAIETECADIEKTAEAVKPDFGKEIFKVANEAVQKEQQELAKIMETRKKELEEEKELAIVGEEDGDKEGGDKKISPKNALAQRIARWRSFSQFPLKQQYTLVVASKGEGSEEAKNMLQTRAIFVMKRIFEHQQVTKEVVVAKNNGLCKDEEWAEVIKSKEVLEAEAKEIDGIAEKQRPGFGKQIFQMAQAQIQKEQQMMQQALARRKAQMDQDVKAREEAKKNGKTIEDLDTKKTKFWQEFTAFPLKEEYKKIVDNTNEKSPEAKNALVSRCVSAMKKIFEHQNIGAELVPARNAQLCSEVEWKEFLRAKAALEEECKDIETTAEKLRPGFGKQIFQMAQQIAMQEQRKHMMEQEAKMKKEAQAKAETAKKSPKSDKKSKKAE